MESHHKKSSTSPMTLPHCSDVSKCSAKDRLFQDFAKKFEKVLDNSGLFPYNSIR